MSFAGTPLGQDRRVDHQTFFSKNSFKGTSLTFTGTQPHPTRTQSINQKVPSYAYGAVPTLAAHPTNSPPRQSRQQVEARQEGDEEDTQREILYNTLKQRNEALSSRPGSSGLQNTQRAPQPMPVSFNDTTVNVANAFQQEALNFGMGTQPAYNNRAVPRSTSVEYEEQTHVITQRRMPIPQRRKPVSKTGSARSIVADVENNQSTESVDANGRGKSPFNSLVDLGSKAATFVMRQRSQEPESMQPPAQQANNSNSYDYANEEEEYEQIEKSGNRSTLSNLTRRPKTSMSNDNKAYQPTHSDDEVSSEEVSDDDNRGRKKKKSQVGTGALKGHSIDYNKKRRKKKTKHGEENSVEDEQVPEPVVEQKSGTSSHLQSSLPPVSAPEQSVTDTSQSMNFSSVNDSTLEPIPETPEKPEEPPKLSVRRTATLNRRPRSRSRSRVRSERTGLGAWLGTGVRNIGIFLSQCISIITFFFANMLGKSIRFLLFQKAGRLLIGCVIAFFAWNTLKSSDISIPSWSKMAYAPPAIPPENADELITRLLQMESMVASLQGDLVTEKDRSEHGAKKLQAIINRLETRVESESDRLRKAEEQSRTASSKSFESLKRELTSLRQLQSEQSSRQIEGPISDEEARAKLRKLEERIGSIEGGVKEAIELSQSAAKAGSVVAAGASTGSHWWNKLSSGSGNSGLTIKTSDGSDVTPLIGALVEQALMHYTADGIARVDYASNSGGASVIPSLTSPTLEMRTSYFFGFFSGPSTYARSPVYALHHETSIGYCWPFAGSQGHLGVVLSVPIYITDFTIDHVPRAVSLDSRPAPRQMEVWGLVEGEDNLEKLRQYRAKLQARREAGEPIPEDSERPAILPANVEYMRVARFMYNVHEDQHVQTFSVPDEVRETGIDFGIVVLFVESNWGSKNYTCLYRFRVHGEQANALPPPDPLEVEVETSS